MTDEKVQKNKSQVYQGIAVLLCIAGILLSLYSLYHFVAVRADLQAGPSICNLGDAFNCDQIARSRYSVFLGVPLASYGLWFYLSLFFFCLLGFSALMTRVTSLSSLYAIAFISCLYSLYLFYIAKFKIGTLCLVCIGMYAVNFGLLACAALMARACSLKQITALSEGAKNLFLWPFIAVRLVRRDKVSGRQSLVALIGLVGTLTLLVVIGMKSVQMTYDTLISFGRGQIQIDRALQEWKDSPRVAIELSAADYSLGPEDAPLQIVEFLDYECPACRGLYAYMHKLIQENGEKIRFTLKNYPLDHSCNKSVPPDFHKYSCISAELARCAGEQGQFWQVSDYLMQSPLLEDDMEVDTFLEAALADLEQIGLDAVGLKECLDSKRSLKQIQSDIELGNSLDIGGTPTVYVNGRKLERVSAEIFEKVLADPVSR